MCDRVDGHTRRLRTPVTPAPSRRSRSSARDRELRRASSRSGRSGRATSRRKSRSRPRSHASRPCSKRTYGEHGERRSRSRSRRNYSPGLPRTRRRRESRSCSRARDGRKSRTHQSGQRCSRDLSRGQACDGVHQERVPGQSDAPLEKTNEISGGCSFPESWTGGWFQSGIPGLIAINSSHIQSKGECVESETGGDKFLLYERTEDCYRCMVIHEKHKYVLQYKETYCSPKDSLSSICESISGDAPLYSMFRKEPRPEPQQCPFHPPPFTFTYSRGSGDCANPPSRAESCTDDSRLLLRYMACPDVPGTESNVEELVCLATWKEGSTRYLVGQISQVQRRNSIQSDEDTYRCFIYKGQHNDKSTTYNIAQSGDATCNGLSSPTDGSRTMKLTNSDDEHNRCHFPAWIVDHHKWFSLDHTHQYHFTTKNATLKIMNSDGTIEEKRLVCHSILEQKDNKHITLVAHVTRGCESGHMCLSFDRRSPGVMELRRGAALWDAPQDACSDEAGAGPHVTLITTSLMPTRCPIVGRYSVIDSLADRRRRRQQISMDESEGNSPARECTPGLYTTASAGCGAAQDTIELKSDCTSIVYQCYGSWSVNGVGYAVAAPAARAGRPKTFCFIYAHHTVNDTHGSHQLLSLSAARGCDRAVVPGLTGDKAYNLTINGTCEQSSKYNSLAHRIAPAAILMTSLLLAVR